MHPRRSSTTNTRAFTLVEVLIVVVILGILAATVIPRFATAARASEQAAFVSAVKILADAMAVYYSLEGEFPEDGSSGEVPDGFETYVDIPKYERPTPIGGVWDTERYSFSITSAVGVHFNDDDAKDDDYMIEVDAIFDDGDLEDGIFRRIADARFYYIVEE